SRFKTGTYLEIYVVNNHRSTFTEHVAMFDFSSTLSITGYNIEDGTDFLADKIITWLA
ncbi:hypothetical protein WA026_006481, partial [Henosepilachna vigintioctopunctata]